MKYKDRLFRALPRMSTGSLDEGVNPPSRREFVYGSLIYDENVPFIVEGGVVEATDEYIQLSRWTPVEKSTIGMCSGIRDKNGKMIYEGDIVRRGIRSYRYGYGYRNKNILPCLGVVYFLSGSFSLNFLGVFPAFVEDYEADGANYIFHDSPSGMGGYVMEVIDNIHGGCVR